MVNSAMTDHRTGLSDRTHRFNGHVLRIYAVGLLRCRVSNPELSYPKADSLTIRLPTAVDSMRGTIV